MSATRRAALTTTSWRALGSNAEGTANTANTGAQYSAEVAKGDKGITVQDKAKGQQVELHALWLRERTMQEAHIFVGAGQRRFTVSELFGTAAATVKDAFVREEKLHLVYGDGYQDALDVKTVLDEAHDPYVLPTRYNEEFQMISQRTPQRKLWRGKLFAPMLVRLEAALL